MLRLFRHLWAFIWSPASSALAALFIGIEGLLPARDRSLAAIIAVASFVVVNGFISFVREHSMSARVNTFGIEITRKLTDLIASLAEISADQYHVWKVDLYVAEWALGRSRQFPWLAGRSLRRMSSVALATTVLFGDTTSRDQGGILSRSFLRVRADMWVNPDLGLELPEDLSWVDSSPDPDLVSTCGLLRVFPVANSVDQNCIGVLAVHVERQFGAQMIGTIGGDACANRLHRAAVDLHHLIAQR